MRGFKMSWFFIIFFLGLSSSNLEAREDRKVSSAVVVGTVYCDTCFQEDFSKSSHFISGASVAVECKDGDSKPGFRQEVKTNEQGEFKVHLPFSVSKHVKKIKRCSVKLISSSEPYCAVASTASSSSIRLKSRKEGTHIFSAGFFTFKPLKQPNLCSQKPSLENSEQLNSKLASQQFPPIENPGFPPPLQDPTTPDLPPLGQNHLPPLPLLPKLPPLPELPPLPTLPGLPYLPPIPGKTTPKKPDELSRKLSPGKTTQTNPEELSRTTELSDKKVAHPDFFFPPNPFQSPPILPPNPLQPPPLFPPNPFQPPGLLPPNPLQPPPSPLIPLPPIPGLTPPPPPAFPFPLPPFPFPPIPPFPGIPPAASSPKKHSP